MFLGIFHSISNVCSEFEVDESALVESKVILAYYSYEDYSGTAYVLFEKNGKLYEVHGSHCSCYGLEGQWDPEETTMESIKHRLFEGSLGHSYYGGNEFANELKFILGYKDVN